MSTLISVSNKSRCVIIVFLLLSVSFMACSNGHRAISSYENLLILPYDDVNKLDNKWSSYLADHLNKRAEEKNYILTLEPKDADYLKILVNVDSTMTDDYAIIPQNNSLILKAVDEKKMLWLVYQFISGVGEDNYRIVSSDLPPAIIAINEAQGKFNFDYLSIFSPANRIPDIFPILATNNINYDWG